MVCRPVRATGSHTGVAPMALTLYADPPPTYTTPVTSKMMMKLVPQPDSQEYVTSYVFPHPNAGSFSVGEVPTHGWVGDDGA